MRIENTQISLISDNQFAINLENDYAIFYNFGAAANPGAPAGQLQLAFFCLLQTSDHEAVSIEISNDITVGVKVLDITGSDDKLSLWYVNITMAHETGTPLVIEVPEVPAGSSGRPRKPKTRPINISG